MAQTVTIEDDWLPLAININALPEPIRKYIHDIETNADPAGMVAQNQFLRMQVDQLQKRCCFVDGCFYIHKRGENLCHTPMI